jgi:serine/threonine protein kinase
MFKHSNKTRVNERPKNDENGQIQTMKNTDHQECIPEMMLSASVGDTIHSGSHGKRVLGGTKLKTAMMTNKWTTHDFPMSRQIGSGHFGSIFLASYKGKADDNKTPTKNQKVVLKCFAKSQIQSDRTTIELVQREICIQSLCVSK